MKKIFSLSLMAVALLISGNAKADTYTATSLQDAFQHANDVPGSVVNFTLTNSISYSEQLILGEAGTKGTSTKAGSTINLNLGGKTITANVGTGKNFITVYKGTLNISNGTINFTSNTAKAKAIDIYGASNSGESNWSIVNIAEGVSITSNEYAIVITENGTKPEELKNVYGVVLNVDGYVYGRKYGIKVNGNVRGTGENIAKVTIGKTGEVACISSTQDAALDKESTACYGAGTANWFIYGYVHGNIGVTVKGGTFVIEDATVVGEGDGYETVTAGGSGINGGAGCGILISSQTNYGGNQSVTIKGDSKISAEDGFAINETIPEGDKTGESTTSLLNIEGGTISGGEQGAIIITEEAKDGDVVKIYGAQVQGDSYTGAQELDLDDIKAEGTFVRTIIVDGEEVAVISKGTEPAETPIKISDATDNASIIVAEGNDAISGAKTLGYVEMPNASVVTLNSGAVLKIDKLVMGDDAQFVIMPGAKLLVMGEQGMVAGVASNLVIKADATGMGTFVFNPAVTSNRSPYATVEYVSNAGQYDGENFYSAICCPFAVLDTVYTKENVGIVTKYCNGSLWVNFGTKRQDFIDNVKPFQMVLTRPAADLNQGITYVFKGQLQGNISGKIALKKGFNYIGSAFLADMNAQKMISIIQESGAKVRTLVYLWDMLNSSYNLYSGNLNTLGNLQPMDAFVLYADQDCTIDLNYNELIWKNYIE